MEKNKVYRKSKGEEVNIKLKNKKSFFKKLIRGNTLLLLSIIILAFLLRIYKLEDVPPGFFPDEVMFGYNAYSISSIFRDAENHFPTIVSSWDHYNILSFFQYFMVVVVYLLGPSVFAARLSVGLYGVGSVFLTYFVIKELFASERVALLSSLFLSISPWFFVENRFAQEYSSIPFYLLLSLYLFLLGIKNRKIAYTLLSSVSFAVCSHTHPIARLFVPMFLVILLVVYYRDIIKERRTYILGFGIYLLLGAAPLVYYYLQSSELVFQRFNSVSVFTESTFNQTKQFIDASPYLQLIPQNNAVIYGVAILRNYFSHISPNFLFFEGGPNKRMSIPGYGQLYVFELPLIALGLYWCVRSIRRNEAKLLILWLLVFSIPADFTIVDIPHPNRSFTVIPIFSVFSALGVNQILTGYNKRRKHKNEFLGVAISLILSIFSIYSIYVIFNFFNYYFNEYPKIGLQPEHWNSMFHTDVGKAIGFTESLDKKQYDKIILTDKCCYFSEYYLAFFTKYPPEDFIHRNRSKLRMGRYEQGNIYSQCMQNAKNPKTVYIAKKSDVVNLDVLHTVYTPAGEVSFIIGVNCTPKGIFIKDWMVCGVFENVNRSGFSKAHINETRGFTENDCNGGKWTELHSDQVSTLEGHIDLSRYYNTGEPGIAYAHTYIYSSQKQVLQIRYGSDDGIKIWLNGVLIEENLATRSSWPDQNNVEVTLNEGWNSLLVKSENYIGGGWSFFMRLSRLNGEEPYGVISSLDT